MRWLHEVAGLYRWASAAERVEITLAIVSILGLVLVAVLVVFL